MKALIATGLAVVGLGGLLVANSGRSASAQGAAPAQVVSQAPASRATLVNCGEGRQALISTDPSQGGVAQVDCVSRDAASLPLGTAVMPVGQQFMPVGQQFVDPVAPPQIVRPAMRERVVYRDRVAQRPVARTYPAEAAPEYKSTASQTTTAADRPARTRSWQRSALIIGGTTAAGAGVGAVIDGKDGAKKGAVAGLIGGTVFDIATRTKR